MKHAYTSAILAFIVAFNLAGTARAQDPNDPGILEPVLSAIRGTAVRIPNTDQAAGDRLLNVVGSITRTDAEKATSMMGHPITHVASPNDDMKEALDRMSDAAKDEETEPMRAAAQELMNILLGQTRGRIYDGFAMLNYSRGGFRSDHVDGEYKMKELRPTGQTEPGLDGEPRQVWETSVNLLYYDGQIDSDVFLLRIPVEMHRFDIIRIHYTIYSLEREDFSPTAVTRDHRMPRSVQFPFKGFDATWSPIQSDEVMKITIDYPPNRLLRGVYTWGWRVHPPRIQFLQPVFEHVNAHTGKVELEPQGKSYAVRNRQLSIDDISDAAPEKKMYRVAKAVLDGAAPETVAAWLDEPGEGPRGTWDAWADLAQNQRHLPPEAWDLLENEGLSEGKFGPYRFVTVYMNNEMYGEGPDGNQIEGWHQGDRFRVKLINLDRHTHYFRNVDFGPRLHDDISNCCGAGRHSFEIMNFKPTYGAPKVAEMQWRAGWGFRPHHNIIQQPDVFPRSSDRTELTPFFGGFGEEYLGYQYSATVRGGDFRFNPPGFIITDRGKEPPHPLREGNGSTGLLIGQHTKGYGTAKMCDASAHPLPGFCERDLSAYNPNGVLNRDTDGDGQNDALWFPPFLRNPDPSSGGDIIPPTPAWKPFLFINPDNGTLFIDPSNPSKGYWVDRTYAHGAPVYAGQSRTATIEAPRGSAQVFYQFDDLFHDNAIFSPHPTFQAGGDAIASSSPEPASHSASEEPLEQADVYPNPSHERATIRYTVQSAGNVSVSVYNMLGQRIATLVDERQPLGPQEIVFDTGNLASGVYLMRIQTTGRSMIRRLTVVR